MAKSQGFSLVLLHIVLLSAVVLVTCEDLVSQVAQKRFGFDWKEWKKEKKEPQPENLPGGFGTYPLWKFHKFDGFSLRPVPMQLDIGYGIPPPPPTYMPQTAYSGGGGYGQQQYAPPPPPPPPQTYSQPSYGSSYSQPPPPPPPPQQQPSYSAPPMSMGYQQVQPSNYAPSQPAYGPPPQQQQQYGPPPPPPPPQQQYGAQDMSYSPSAPQPAAALPPAGSFVPKNPAYGSFEGPNSYGNVQELAMPVDPSNGGFVKRFYTVGNNEQEKQQQAQKNEPDSKTKQ